MKANWKARNKQYNDRQKGEIFDVGIGCTQSLFWLWCEKIVSA